MSKIIQFKQKPQCKYTVAVLLYHETGEIVEMDIQDLMQKLDLNNINTLIAYMYSLKSAKLLRLA